MVAPFAPDPRKRDVASALFVASVIIAPIPTLAGLVTWTVLFWLDNHLLFLLLPTTSALALALALSGLYILRTIGARTGLFVAAVALLGLNLVAAALASFAWFTSITCGGGYSGPCFWPYSFCGSGLVLDFIAAVLVGVGILQLRRHRGPLPIVPPPVPPP